MNREQLIKVIAEHQDVDPKEVGEDFVKNMDSLEALDLEIEIEVQDRTIGFSSDFEFSNRTLTEILEEIENGKE